MSDKEYSEEFDRLTFRFMYPYPGEGFRGTDDSGSVGTVGVPINMER